MLSMVARVLQFQARSKASIIGIKAACDVHVMHMQHAGFAFSFSFFFFFFTSQVWFSVDRTP